MEKEYGDTTKHLRIQGCSYIFYKSRRSW